MHGHADQQADDEVEERDKQSGDGIALDEFRCAVERAEKGRLCLLALAPDLGLGMVDGAGVHVAVECKLPPRHPVEREAGTDLGHAARAFGDDHEIHNQQHAEDDEAQ